jgi:hypothetical protein
MSDTPVLPRFRLMTKSRGEVPLRVHSTCILSRRSLDSNKQLFWFIPMKDIPRATYRTTSRTVPDIPTTNLTRANASTAMAGRLQAAQLHAAATPRMRDNLAELLVVSDNTLLKTIYARTQLATHSMDRPTVLTEKVRDAPLKRFAIVVFTSLTSTFSVATRELRMIDMTFDTSARHNICWNISRHSVPCEFDLRGPVHTNFDIVQLPVNQKWGSLVQRAYAFVMTHLTCNHRQFTG